MNQTNELKEAIKEASISIACAIDDAGEPYCNEECEKDLERIQDKITEIENIVLPAQLILFFDDDRGFDYVEQDSTKYIP
tara:strand:- start:260 stop:499 length:240 start_codon:yes stop_codon:yes gene_type:complete